MGVRGLRMAKINTAANDEVEFVISISYQILLTYSQGNVWGQERRIYYQIVGFKGLKVVQHFP